MKCTYCGNELKDTDEVCEKCGTPVNGVDLNENEEKEANLLCWISLLLSGIPLILNLTILRHTNFFDLGRILFVISFSLMIYVRTKYKKNKFGKIIMWIYIIGLILLVVALLSAFVWIMVSCSNMNP